MNPCINYFLRSKWETSKHICFHGALAKRALLPRRSWDLGQLHSGVKPKDVLPGASAVGTRRQGRDRRLCRAFSDRATHKQNCSIARMSEPGAQSWFSPTALCPDGKAKMCITFPRSLCSEAKLRTLVSQVLGPELSHLLSMPTFKVRRALCISKPSKGFFELPQDLNIIGWE